MSDTAETPSNNDLSERERPKDPAELSAGARVFQKPVIHGDETEEERSASWLELFFDLFFVAAIARIAHHLAGHYSTEELLKFIVVFAAIWWVWMSDTYYNIRFETKGALQRLYVVALMFPVLGMAIFGTQGLSERMIGFALAFGIARAINGLMWARAAFHLPRTRPMIKWIILTWLASMAVLNLVFVVPTEWVLGVLAASVLISISGAGLSAPGQRDLPALPRDKLPERHGLFIIIILGETIVPLAVPPEEMQGYGTYGLIASGILVAIGFWWTYFDFIARRPPRKSVKTFMLWGYLHLPLALLLTLNGVGVAMLIKGDIAIAGDFLLYAAGGSLLSIAALEWPVEHGASQPYPFPESPLIKVGLAAVLIGVAWFTEASRILSLSLVLGSLLICVLYSVWRFASASAEQLEEFEA